ncbi:hypothetical protein BGZ65_005020, partial [Modicella reniformis]
MKLTYSVLTLYAIVTMAHATFTDAKPVINTVSNQVQGATEGITDKISKHLPVTPGSSMPVAKRDFIYIFPKNVTKDTPEKFEGIKDVFDETITPAKEKGYEIGDPLATKYVPDETITPAKENGYEIGDPLVTKYVPDETITPAKERYEIGDPLVTNDVLDKTITLAKEKGFEIADSILLQPIP